LTIQIDLPEMSPASRFWRERQKSLNKLIDPKKEEEKN
jgi:hypothetical protein